jgi:hypothetical protein
VELRVPEVCLLESGTGFEHGLPEIDGLEPTLDEVHPVDEGGAEKEVSPWKLTS